MIFPSVRITNRREEEEEIEKNQKAIVFYFIFSGRQRKFATFNEKISSQ